MSYSVIDGLVSYCIAAGEVESLQSSLHTSTGRMNQLQRTNVLLETQLKSLKVVLCDAERRQAAAAADATHLSTGHDLEMKRQLHEISQLKQQVLSLGLPIRQIRFYNSLICYYRTVYDVSVDIRWTKLL